MKNKIIYLLVGTMVLFSSCLNRDFGEVNTEQEIKENVRNIFGTDFDPLHDWCTTLNETLEINDIPSDVKKVQVLALVNENDTTTSLLVLNEASVNGRASITVRYDVPSNNNGIYVFDGNSYFKANNNTVSMETKALARGFKANRVPKATPTIGEAIESFASQRGWIEGEFLYGLTEEAYLDEATQVDDYDTEFKQLFRTVIFSYFPNGRQYNNLPLIKESGFYNEKVYPISTGDKPIVVSPVYKSDKAKQYGNEVYNSDFYYYYFKESDLKAYVDGGGNEVDFLTNLPKYKAIQFNQHFGETEDDVISKRNSFTLIYWGDGTPEIGTEGVYMFPEGYKIGFMVRAKTDFKENGKPRKQGELYGDGRLNNFINNYSECNFKGSKLGNDGPRMGWIKLNDKLLLCCESGTDSDFNDIILEVEGGVEDIPFIPEFDNGVYTFCFEDREIGDYDMNDIVMKASRINEDTVEYSIVACGAHDALYIVNIFGNVINSNTEVHEMFRVPLTQFINTVKDARKYKPITERIKVDKDFSFLDTETQPHLYDATTNKEIFLSRKGQDPHGIMIPNDFRYPIEGCCIKNAYSKFNIWGENRITSTDWYLYFDEDKVY